MTVCRHQGAGLFGEELEAADAAASGDWAPEHGSQCGHSPHDMYQAQVSVGSQVPKSWQSHR
jgi:hypothetical protein